MKQSEEVAAAWMSAAGWLMAYLVVFIDGKEWCRRKLEGLTVLGRALEADFCLPDPALSRKHCQLEPAGEDWILSDLGSRNGTYYQRQQIRATTIHDHETFRIGSLRIAFHADDFVRARPSDPVAAMEENSRPLELDLEKEYGVWQRPLPVLRLPQPVMREVPAISTGLIESGPADDTKVMASPLAFSRPPAKPIPMVKGEVPPEPQAADEPQGKFGGLWSTVTMLLSKKRAAEEEEAEVSEVPPR